jgi:ring-1,2-phenylacetyl-CoA epoxidase subunit PaaD
MSMGERKKAPGQGQQEVVGGLYDEQVACPWCESKNTRVISPFGGTVSEISMQCDDCKSTFGWMKWEGKLPDSN